MASTTVPRSWLISAPRRSRPTDDSSETLFQRGSQSPVNLRLHLFGHRRKRRGVVAADHGAIRCANIGGAVACCSPLRPPCRRMRRRILLPLVRAAGARGARRLRYPAGEPNVGSTNLSSQLQQIFGTTTIAPYGRLQGTLCWHSTPRPARRACATPANRESETAPVQQPLIPQPWPRRRRPCPHHRVPSRRSTFRPPSATISLSFSGGSPQWTAGISPANLTTSWLTVSPVSGTGAAQLKLSANSAGLANGVYNATLLIQCAGATPQFTSVPATLVVGGSSAITIGAVTNGASYRTALLPAC